MEGVMDQIQLYSVATPPKRKKNLVGWILGTFLGVILLVTIATIIIRENYACVDRYLTYENYLKIENGMTYSQVSHIFGNYGGKLELSSGYGPGSLKYYSWSASKSYDMRVVTVCFEDDKVVSKAQIGLG